MSPISRLMPLVMIVALAVTSASAQGPITGTPRFESFAGGPDVINLGNLNVHYAIPIRHKSGRGTDFAYDLTYDSSVWYPAGSTWQPTSTTTVPGWQGLVPAGQSYILYSVTYNSASCWNGGPTSYQQWSFSNFVYYDPLGASHLFNYSPTYFSSPGGSNCPPNGPQPSTPQPTQASDSSGYTIYATPGPGSASAYLVDKNGNTINVPVVTSPPTSGSSTTTDRNGNQTSSSNGTYTDTLGTQALAVIGTAPSNTNISYTAPSGATATYVVSYVTYTVRTNFGCGITEYNASGTMQTSLVDRVTLPDGSYYQFNYETTYQDSHSPHHVTGRIASVRLPTGGTISYQYSSGGTGVNAISCSDGSATTLVRTTPDTGTNSWTYTRTQVSGTHWQTLISDPTSPTSNQTLIDFQKDSGSTSNFYETNRQVFQGSTSGTLLLTTNTCYNGSASPCTSATVTSPISSVAVVSILPGTSNLQSKRFSSYDQNYGLLLEADDYDYGSGAPPASPLRKTVISYAPLGNGIVDMPGTVTIQDGSGATKAQTTYTYDQGTPAPTSNTPQHVTISGSRGNPTTIAKLVQGSTTLTETFTYYDTGNVQTFTDVNGGQATYTYGACGNSFPTSISEPLSLSRSMTWDSTCTGGVQLTATDENGKITTAAYANDPYYWRPDSVTGPTGAAVSFCYGLLSSSTGTCTRNISQVESTVNFNSNNSTVDTLTVFNGLGRTHIQQIRQSPTATTFDSVETDYDSLGRVSRVTLPYSGTAGQTCPSGPSCPAATTSYDALSRLSQVTDAGGGSATYSPYSNNDVVITMGPAPSGENTKRRQLEYDALGRLTSVCEITGLSQSGACGQNTAQTGFWSKYVYDALSNLTGVTQNAQPNGSPQTRSYSFDGLSRLTSETNPESGTTTYVFDTTGASSCNSGSTYYGDLVRKVDANGNNTCFYYDSLHRLTDVGTSGPNATPCKRYRYDNSAGVLGSIPSGVVVSNTLGRIVEAETDTCAWPITQSSIITDEWFSYTARGEKSDVYESTPHSGGYYHFSAQYWASGALSQLGNNVAGMPAFTYGADGEGRINTVFASSGQNPVTGVTYNNSSLATQVTFGSGDTDIFAYDSNTLRMNQYQFNINAQSLTGALTWNANGSLNQQAITDPFNSPDTQTCNYSHDDLTRIASANCGAAASQTFSFDPFGNISKSGSPYQFQPTYNSATNRFATIPGTTPSYDSNGNVSSDGSHTYAWDANGNSTSIDGVSLTFDALDRLVEQNRSGSYTQIVYGPTGGKLALMSGQTLQKAFIPLPGQATAVYTSSGLDHYRHSDWLGSARLTSSPSRTVVSTTAYAPFGEPYAQSGTADLSFTGMNPDTVSSDYDFLAREYSIQGRWPSPDPAGLAAVNPANPQSWNRYSYVINNPLALVDPLGLDYCDGGNNPYTGGGGSTGNLPIYCFYGPGGPGGPAPGPPSEIPDAFIHVDVWEAFLDGPSQCPAGMNCGFGPWTSASSISLGGGGGGGISIPSSPTWAFIKTFFTTLPSTGPDSCIDVALSAVKNPLNTVQNIAKNITKYVPPVTPTLPFGSAWLGSQISRMAAAGAVEGEALGDAAALATVSSAASEAAPAIARATPYGAAIAAELLAAYGVGKEFIAAAKGQCKP